MKIEKKKFSNQNPTGSVGEERKRGMNNMIVTQSDRKKKS